MKKRHVSLQWKFLCCIVLIIFPTLGIIFTWAAIQNEKQAVNQAVNQARIVSQQVILTRQWISDCGGIFVDMQSRGAKDISYFVNDSLRTPAGLYQRFTPSMVTRKLSQYSRRQDLYRFRLTSLNPLNPENRADGFEKTALTKFKTDGIHEMFRIASHNGRHYMQYVVPLYLETACLECHRGQGEIPNSVRGGLSVLLPLEKMNASIEKNQLKLVISGAALISLTSFTLFFLMRRFVIKPLKKLETMTDEIGRGNLDARVAIATGDEFEKLGLRFNTMAESLSKGRDLLEEKIALATRELSEANRELQTLDQLKSDFMATISHELRTPLTVIRGGIDYLNRTVKKEDNRNYLEIIDKNLGRLIHLVSDLFDFTKMEAKKIEWSFDQVNLSVLIKEVIEIINPLSTDKQITIRYEDPGDVLADLDLERIEQVLVNLIDNAIKFSDPQTAIQITLQQDAQTVTVAVSDQGIGISEEHLAAIFDKFWTVPTGRYGKIEGTGLGLAICKAINEGHNGSIWAESVKGISSTFYFRLPKKQF